MTAEKALKLTEAGFCFNASDRFKGRSRVSEDEAQCLSELEKQSEQEEEEGIDEEEAVEAMDEEEAAEAQYVQVYQPVPVHGYEQSHLDPDPSQQNHPDPGQHVPL